MTLGQTKIDELDAGIVCLRFEQYIFWFNISMDDALSVQITHGLQYRGDDSRGLFLGEAALLAGVIDDLVEQLAPRVPLGDNMNVVGILVAIHHLHDVGMADLGEQGHLAAEMIQPADFGLVDGLDGVSLPRETVDAFSDGAVVARAQDLGGWGDVVVGGDVREAAGDGADGFVEWYLLIVGKVKGSIINLDYPFVGLKNGWGRSPVKTVSENFTKSLYGNFFFRITAKKTVKWGYRGKTRVLPR